MYTLYNKKNDKYLVHPHYGKWITEEKKECEEMLKYLEEYIISSKYSTISIEDFEIVDYDKQK